MTTATKVVLTLGVVALLVTSVGWFRAAADPDLNRFESCVVTDRAVTLSYGYGANQRTAVVYDSRDGVATVALEIEEGSGDTPDVRRNGQASFEYSGDLAGLRYPDGETVDCQAG
jgi:hypothetical protein